MEIFLALGFILVLYYISNKISKIQERKSWNGGQCPTCNRPWRHFITYSDGCRHYTCDRCGRIIKLNKIWQNNNQSQQTEP